MGLGSLLTNAVGIVIVSLCQTDCEEDQAQRSNIDIIRNVILNFQDHQKIQGVQPSVIYLDTILPMRVSAVSSLLPFFFKAFCVCAVIHWIADTLSPELRKHVTILTDNTNIMDIFNFLQATLTYNPILKSAVNGMISHGIDLQVLTAYSRL
ncbi:hypothetical protein F5146DRAFT_1130228 [Armillaria mellea]|nr:hypothetical protein F5146DRAFT_1130228 [Armillaria mellea]